MGFSGSPVHCYTALVHRPLADACCAAVFLLPLMFSQAYRGKHRETLEKQWKGIAAIGTFMAANIALNNTSLVRSSCARGHTAS